MSDAAASKQTIRRAALGRRAAQTDKDAHSAQIVQTLYALPEFVAAGTVLIYLDVRSEVRTRHALPDLLAPGRTIVVPWCDGGQLRLFRLLSLDDLDCGSYGILEPRAELRMKPDRMIEPHALDLVVAPGVAFDRQGGRLGHGMGYFDKLLAQIRPDATLVGLAFECQLVPHVPVELHDVPMDIVVTEVGISRAARRGRRG